MQISAYALSFTVDEKTTPGNVPEPMNTRQVQEQVEEEEEESRPLQFP